MYKSLRDMENDIQNVVKLIKTDSKALVRAAKYFATYYIATTLDKNPTRFKMTGGYIKKKMLIISIVQHITKYNTMPTMKQANLLKDFLISFEPIHWLLSEVMNGKIEKGFPITDSELLAFNTEYHNDYAKTH